MEKSENRSSGINHFDKLAKIADVSSLSQNEREEYEQSLRNLHENVAIEKVR